jgi:hypothetical protein
MMAPWYNSDGDLRIVALSSRPDGVTDENFATIIYDGNADCNGWRQIPGPCDGTSYQGTSPASPLFVGGMTKDKDGNLTSWRAQSSGDFNLIYNPEGTSNWFDYTAGAVYFSDSTPTAPSANSTLTVSSSAGAVLWNTSPTWVSASTYSGYTGCTSPPGTCLRSYDYPTDTNSAFGTVGTNVAGALFLTRDRVTNFGGDQTYISDASNNVWYWTGSAWTEVAPPYTSGSNECSGGSDVVIPTMIAAKDGWVFTIAGDGSSNPGYVYANSYINSSENSSDYCWESIAGNSDCSSGWLSIATDNSLTDSVPGSGGDNADFWVTCSSNSLYYHTGLL